MDLIREYNLRCAPMWAEAELRHKLRSAANTPHRRPRGYLLGRSEIKAIGVGKSQSYVLPNVEISKPVFCPEVLRRIASKTYAVENIYESVINASPVPVGELDSAAFLRFLYPSGSGEKVLIFSDMRSQGQLLSFRVGRRTVSCRVSKVFSTARSSTK